MRRYRKREEYRMSSSSEKSSHPGSGHRKRGLNFCSTPVIGKGTWPSSTSISAVDTNSSSSAKRRHREQITARNYERERIKSKSQEKKLKPRKKLKQVTEKRHETKERKRKKRKKESIVQKNSDTDWRTCDEISWKPSMEKPTSGSESDVLFKDLRSPERVREAPQFVERHLESPIFRSRRWKDESPEKITFEKNEEILPLKNFPSSHIGLADSDDEQSSICLRKEDAVKTYLGLRKEKRNKNNLRIDKCKEWLVKVSIPTDSSDFLWDNFVKNNYESVCKYLAPLCNKQESPLNKQAEHFEIDNHEVISKLKFHRELESVRKYWNKSLQKWIEVSDVYDFPGTEDNDFEENRRKMTLNQYLQKCKDEKKNIKIIELRSSYSPTHQRNIEKEFRDLTSLDNEKKRKKGPFKNYKFESEKSKTIMANESKSELQRINKIRQFASRLNEMEKTLIANDISLPSTSKYKSNYTVPSLKRTHKEETNDREDCKEQKLLKKSKPTIKSIESLTKVQFKRDKLNWRIT